MDTALTKAATEIAARHHLGPLDVSHVSAIIRGTADKIGLAIDPDAPRKELRTIFVPNEASREIYGEDDPARSLADRMIMAARQVIVRTDFRFVRGLDRDVTRAAFLHAVGVVGRSRPGAVTPGATLDGSSMAYTL